MRNAEIGRKDFKLNRYTEAFTSENWIVRIYKVDPWPNRGDFKKPVVKFERKDSADLKKHKLSTEKTKKPNL